ncbi:MAG: asparagine synthase (glutamine-hydrolyzing) [bacterium]
MCGICGVIERDADNSKLVRSMADLLAHRGPDDAGVYQSGDFCLGHRRLSIIDLVTGSQPILNDDKTLAIVFNGEIYNYRKLRKELVDEGLRFRTQSDTEVILRLYESHGVQSFERLNGIFAFAILDERNHPSKLVLARDHFGIKPLHYYEKDGLFIFASEQKAILIHPRVERQLNAQALHYHLNLRYTQSPETLFKGIHRLPPAHYMVVEQGQIRKIEAYYNLRPEINYEKSEAEWLEEIPNYLKQAVERQLVSDVPVGVYLSGGMDSSAIVAMMREIGVEKIKTFTLGFNEPTDELNDAQIVADRFDTEHHALRMEMNPMRYLPEVIWHAEEPKVNLLQGFMMSQFVSQHVKVTLGGLGGDELFSGYDIHRYIYPFNRLHRAVPRAIEQNMLAKLSSLAYALQTRMGSFASDEYRRGVQMVLATGNIAKSYLILRNAWDFDKANLANIYTPQFLERNLEPVMSQFEMFFSRNSGLTPLDEVYLAEFHSKMVNDYLLTEDRMSMSHSVEERVPFLDLDLVALGFSIPANLKMRGNQTKYLLRKAMEPYLPERILQKKKWGFTFNPYLQYLKDLKTTAETILTKEAIERDGIFNYDYIRSIFDAKPHPKMRWHYNFIWMLTGFYIWKRMFLDGNGFVEKEFSLEKYVEKI